MADDIKKTNDEVKENTTNTTDTQEGAISDDAAEAVAGGRVSERSKPEFLKNKVHADPTLTKDRR